MRKMLRTSYCRLKAGCSDCVCLSLRVNVCYGKAFLPVFFFRHLKITLDSEQPMLKEKRIIPSV